MEESSNSRLTSAVTSNSKILSDGMVRDQGAENAISADTARVPKLVSVVKIQY
jgi:hypothetical protein